MGEGEARARAGDEEKSDFGDELPGEPQPAGAQRRAHRELGSPPQRAADEKTGHVAAGHEQGQHCAREDDRQRCAEPIDPEVLEWAHADAGCPIRLRVRALQIARDGVHLGQGLVEIGARRQPPDRPQIPRSAVGARRAILAVVQREPDLGTVLHREGRKREALAEDAGDGEAAAIEAQAGTDDLRVGAEPRVPVGVGQDDVGVRSGKAAQIRGRAEERIQTRAGGADAHAFRQLSVGADPYLVPPRGQAVEAPAALPPVAEVRVRYRQPRQSPPRIASHHPDEPAGVLERERAEQRLVGEAPDRGREAEGNRQNEHDAEREARIATEETEAVA